MLVSVCLHHTGSLLITASHFLETGHQLVPVPALGGLDLGFPYRFPLHTVSVPHQRLLPFPALHVAKLLMWQPCQQEVNQKNSQLPNTCFMNLLNYRLSRTEEGTPKIRPPKAVWQAGHWAACLCPHSHLCLAPTRRQGTAVC